MEVADQWRREWAGTAEYGKVTEGGVTRRVARAMEVLHASGPGSRVRVMRAAYHSSAGPGAPAESFMLHSSRRVISSGFNFLESPSLPTKPLEISSTPLELIHDSNGETENYKVTEPDDLDISEPSKWRGSARGSSIRMPSEESSSTDNASIIDLDARSSKNLHRKYSYDSESSDVQLRSRSSSGTSQHLDAPTALSTLKYKSLLNNSNEWNNRRKSYSFEDTSPLNETILHSNDTLAMESSTDSGICKSTEIMNDQVDDNSHIKYFGKADTKIQNKEESFRDWLSKNRQNSQYRGTKFKTYREHEIVMEDPKENNIALKSPGKVSITLPITIEADNDSKPRNKRITEDVERRVKKVEFCKTEVHFAAESGKVNIIATDEKPPPTSDFRKRRSAFVPMQDIRDRPITLFGENPDFPILNEVGTTYNVVNNDIGESDENTAATKSILKNKIPKPKPYLLGENMDFGFSDDVSTKTTDNSVLTAVSLVNQQLESEKRYKNEFGTTFTKEEERNVINNHVFRTINAGPTMNDSLKPEKYVMTNVKIEKAKESQDVKRKLNPLQPSAVPVKPKTRQLRESDLMYFGIDDRQAACKEPLKRIEHTFKRDNVANDIFHSVKLIQQISNSVSNSVCNSDLESDDVPEYQNIPLNNNYAPVPTPRLRSKYDDTFNEINKVRAGLRPIVEKDGDETKDAVKSSSRRTKMRRHEEVKASRSLSEPPKNFKLNSMEKSHRRNGQLSRSNKQSIETKSKHDLKQLSTNDTKSSDANTPIYVNFKVDIEKLIPDIEKSNKPSVSPRRSLTPKTNPTRNKHERIVATPVSDYDYSHSLKEHQPELPVSTPQNKHSLKKDTLSSSLKKEVVATRTEKSNRPHHNKEPRRKITEELSSKKAQIQECKYSDQNNTTENKEHKSRALQRSIPKSTSDESGEAKRDHSAKNRDTSSHRKRHSSKDKINSIRENIKPALKMDGNYDIRPTTQIKSNEREKELDSRASNHKINKHREYVINYDDKNGTVSSICKIKPGHGSPKRKKSSKDILKENNKDNALKIKSIDKIALQQSEDHHRHPNRLIYADRKWKTKVHLQRSCQVL